MMIMMKHSCTCEGGLDVRGEYIPNKDPNKHYVTQSSELNQTIKQTGGIQF